MVVGVNANQLFLYLLLFLLKKLSHKGQRFLLNKKVENINISNYNHLIT